jgi:hypothetical protein
LSVDEKNTIHDINFVAGNTLIVEKIIINKDKPENESRGSNKFVPKYFTWRFIDFVKEEIVLEIDNKSRRSTQTIDEPED